LISIIGSGYLNRDPCISESLIELFIEKSEEKENRKENRRQTHIHRATRKVLLTVYYSVCSLYVILYCSYPYTNSIYVIYNCSEHHVAHLHLILSLVMSSEMHLRGHLRDASQRCASQRCISEVTSETHLRGVHLRDYLRDASQRSPQRCISELPLIIILGSLIIYLFISSI
jgi:hypothetical protein